MKARVIFFCSCGSNIKTAFATEGAAEQFRAEVWQPAHSGPDHAPTTAPRKGAATATRPGRHSKLRYDDEAYHSD